MRGALLALAAIAGLAALAAALSGGAAAAPDRAPSARVGAPPLARFASCRGFLAYVRRGCARGGRLVGGRGRAAGERRRHGRQAGECGQGEECSTHRHMMSRWRDGITTRAVSQVCAPRRGRGPLRGD